MVTVIKTLKQEVKNENKLTNTLETKFDNQIQALRRVSERINILTNYKTPVPHKTLINLSIIFLIAVLENFLRETFRVFVNTHFRKLNFNDDLKIRWGDLTKLDFNAGDIILQRAQDINFQSIRTIFDAFKNNLGISIEDSLTKKERENLIFFQATRHSIIHRGGRVDSEFIKQIKGTKFFDKFEKREGKELIFSFEELEKIKVIIKKFVCKLTTKLNQHHRKLIEE